MLQGPERMIFPENHMSTLQVKIRKSVVIMGRIYADRIPNAGEIWIKSALRIQLELGAPVE